LVLTVSAAQFACTTRKSAETDASPEVTDDYLNREESFSLVIFEGDVEGELAALLDALGYRQVASGRARLPVRELSWRLAGASTRTEVQKAIFRHGGHTVLMDPEMVVAELGTEHIKRLCSRHSIAAISVIWERVSETVFVREWTSTGEIRETYLEGGAVPEDAPKPAHSILVRQPNPTGVRALLRGRGIPREVLTAEVQATVVVLSAS